MAFFSAYMLRMSLELAMEDETYQDIALRYLTHYVRMVDALQGNNKLSWIIVNFYRLS